MASPSSPRGTSSESLASKDQAASSRIKTLYYIMQTVEVAACSAMAECLPESADSSSEIPANARSIESEYASRMRPEYHTGYSCLCPLETEEGWRGRGNGGSLRLCHEDRHAQSA